MKAIVGLSGLTLIMSAGCAAPVHAPRNASRPPAVASVDRQQEPRADARPPLLEERVRMAMLGPSSERAVLLPASGRSCSIDVGVTDLGGVSVTYRAPPGHEQRLRVSVHAMAARHNERGAIGPGGSNDALAKAAALAHVESVAVVEDMPGGARVVLVPEEAWAVRELFEHIEAHAPDLFPAALRARRCPTRAKTRDR